MEGFVGKLFWTHPNITHQVAIIDMYPFLKEYNFSNRKCESY